MKIIPKENITSVLGTIIAFDVSYREALENIETLRAEGVTQINLHKHLIVTEGEEDVFQGDEKPWNAAVEVYFSGSLTQDGGAYAEVTAFEHGMTFKWGVRFEFCQSHGHLLLGALPETARKGLLESMRNSADSKESTARRLKKEAQEALENASLIRSLYRRD